MDASEAGSPFQAGTGPSPVASPFQATRPPSPGAGSPAFHAAMAPSADGSPDFHTAAVTMAPSVAETVVATLGFSFQSAVAAMAPGASGCPPFQAVWVVMWRSRRVRWEKYLLQMQHWKRSGRWVRMCTLRELFWVKRLQQMEHWKARTPVCVTMCLRR